MSQYNLKISDLYDLLIGDGYKLFIDSVVPNIAAAKWWDGSEWRLVYEASYFDGTDMNQEGRIKYYNGTGWVSASLK